jgi:hypothetical protein
MEVAPESGIEDVGGGGAGKRPASKKKSGGSATAAAASDELEEGPAAAAKTDLIAAGADVVKAVEKAGGAVVDAVEKAEIVAEVAGKNAITQVWGILTQHKFLVGGLAIGVPTLMAAFTDVFSTKPTKNTNRRWF